MLRDSTINPDQRARCRLTGLQGYFALKELNVAAQGVTLGNGNKKNMNPEGVKFQE